MKYPSSHDHFKELIKVEEKEHVHEKHHGLPFLLSMTDYVESYRCLQIYLLTQSFRWLAPPLCWRRWATKLRKWISTLESTTVEDFENQPLKKAKCSESLAGVCFEGGQWSAGSLSTYALSSPAASHKVPSVLFDWKKTSSAVTW